VRGARKVGGLLVQGVRKLLAPRSAGEAADATGTIVDVNGGPAVLFTEGGSPTAVMVLDIDAATDRVADVWLIANPDKLAAVDGLR